MRTFNVARGFTLVEVLVALTIVSVALMASLRAVGVLTQGSVELRARTLAQWLGGVDVGHADCPDRARESPLGSDP